MLKSLFARKPPAPLAGLYTRVVALAREPRWYQQGAVPDTVDGRFDMVALVAALVLLRFEDAGAGAEHAWLTESFIADMDASLREIGVGDMNIGRHVGKAVSALGGRLSAYRAAQADPALWRGALVRNVYRGEDPGAGADWLAAEAARLHERVAALSLDDLRRGRGL